MRTLWRSALLVLLLGSALAQAGIAKWMPRECLDVPPEGVAIHATHAETGSTGVADTALPANGGREHCQRPCFGCDCLDCLSYLDAHTLTLPSPASAPSPALCSETAVAHLTASRADVFLPPPTPPPRS